jgi:putative exporter of polyketide antibiotics
MGSTLHRIFVASVVWWLSLAPVMGFLNPSRSVALPRRVVDIQHAAPATVSTTTLFYDNYDGDSVGKMGGRNEGAVIFAVVFAVCIWVFSIPTEFRRARFCSEEQSATYAQCKTVGQWTSGVAAYYKSGGGVKFDFSIDPATLEENAELQKELYGR